MKKNARKERNMKDINIDITIDGKKFTAKDVRDLEFNRIRHVFTELNQLGGTLYDSNGNQITLNKALSFDFEEAKTALVQTKVTLGPDQILELYKEKLEESDNLWREISANTVKGRNMQHAFVEVDVDGVTLGDFITYNQQLNKSGDTTAPFYIHPEHFVFLPKDGGQYVMETVGMYKEPVYQFIKITPDAKKPIPEDADTKLSLVADAGHLVSDKTDNMMMGMHQFKMKKNGMKIKLGIFFPENAPKEMVDGHKYHLAVEFFNVITYAGQERNLKSKLINFVLKHKKF